MDDPWEKRAPVFVHDHYQSLHGQVRIHVIHETLLGHIAPPPGRVVDVGGGGGNQSIPLARLGYEVTIVDSSPSMLSAAAAALAAESADLRARVRLVDGRGEDATRLLDDTFDVVLCHGVLMYLDDTAPMLDALAALARGGGIVSVVTKQRAGVVALAALEGRWDDALAGFEADTTVNRLGMRTSIHDVDQITEWLAARGVEHTAWYGVRLFTDGWIDDDVDEATTEAIKAVELEAARRDPYRGMSRLFHWVGIAS